MKRAAVAGVLGVVSVGGFAPFYLFPLPPLALACALGLAEREPTPRGRFAVGFAYGLGFFLAGVSWVYVSLHDFGAMPAPVAVGVTVLFGAYLALFPALALLLATMVAHPLIRRCMIFPAAWTVTEWLRGWLMTGFPWLALGYSQAPDSPLAGVAPVLGVYGVGFFAAATGGAALQACAAGLKRIDRRPLVAIALIWAAAWGLKFVAWTTPSGEPVSVSLLQGNVPQSMKWRPESVAGTLHLYEEMIRATRAQLIILPETALPLFLQEVPREFFERIEAHAKANQADVLLGVPELSAPRRYFNSAVSLGTSPPQVYRKSHLVPFGEFIPLRPLLAPIVDSLAIPLTDFSRGADSQQPLALAGQKVAVNICYEDAFGGEIIRQLPAASLLVNVSNVAWFGDSLAPMQHLQIAQMRALETGRHMLRSTNTGVTAVIDPHGEVLERAPTFVRARVDATIRGHTGATPFVVLGNAGAIGLSLLLLLVGMRSRPI